MVTQNKTVSAEQFDALQKQMDAMAKLIEQNNTTNELSKAINKLVESQRPSKPVSTIQADDEQNNIKIYPHNYEFPDGTIAISPSAIK